MYISITLEDIERKLVTELPMVFYELKEGESIKTITFPEEVGGWKPKWIGTDGSIYKGKLTVVPATKLAAQALQRVLRAFYVSLGFDPSMSEYMSREAYKDYWDANKWNRVKYLLRLEDTLFNELVTHVDRGSYKLPKELLSKENSLFDGLSSRDLRENLEITKELKQLTKENK